MKKKKLEAAKTSWHCILCAARRQNANIWFTSQDCTSCIRVTLALNDDGTLYDPELMREVAQAVKRENLEVDTVFAMHQGPHALA